MRGEERVSPALDERIHHPTRLAVMAFLSGCTEAEFRAVREGCGISDSVLSKVVGALEAAEYVKVRKGYVGKRPRTWLRLSPEGRRALLAHLAALRDLAAQAAALGAVADEASAAEA
ncbi:MULTISPECIES: transcriptional regulator [Streptomyces]|uniref:Transcriptional regulator n=1 Tax=Streptomyces sp. 900129855 TaxID=3155129 RepID=A0ABV2ZYQ2_9ACTN